MTIDKAIETLNHLQLPLKTAEEHDVHLAVRLGIEALKLVQRERLLGINPVETQLPGETTE